MTAIDWIGCIWRVVPYLPVLLFECKQQPLLISSWSTAAHLLCEICLKQNGEIGLGRSSIDMPLKWWQSFCLYWHIDRMGLKHTLTHKCRLGESEWVRLGDARSITWMWCVQSVGLGVECKGFSDWVRYHQVAGRKVASEWGKFLLKPVHHTEHKGGWRSYLVAQWRTGKLVWNL